MTDKHGDTPFQCSDHDKRIAMVERSVSSVEKVMDAVSTKLDLILAQITKVAILEEKHSALIVDNDRAHKRIGDLAGKMEYLAIETREFMNYSKGQQKVMWAIGTAVAALIVKALFFAANNGMTP